ncbi:hypothetical protein KC722_01310 [Candidatus Kaiserbacteria bacterium]|nr:hypothetical protein [Candidatus Kaiserbacteria bacterium]MCB9811986.1 hypothetical protein [Candidatus Nomurabacteria bacterium]
MVDKKFLGIRITDDDDYGTIHLRLALDLWMSVRDKAGDVVVEEKARNIIKVCCEPMFDDLIEAYDWNPDETDYADQVLVQCMDVAVAGLIELVRRRVKHTQKRERRTKLQIDDLRVAAVMAYVMMVPENVSDQLEDTFLEDHGAMYFSRSK